MAVAVAPFQLPFLTEGEPPFDLAYAEYVEAERKRHEAAEAQIEAFLNSQDEIEEDDCEEGEWATYAPHNDL